MCRNIASPYAPTNLDNRLARLKHTLRTARDLERVSDQFWDDLADEESFLDMGTPQANPRLDLVVEHICRTVLEREAPALSLLIWSPEHSFWHGCYVVPGLMLHVLYFEDIDSGLLSCTDPLAVAETRFIRFSIYAFETEGTGVVINPRNRYQA